MMQFLQEHGPHFIYWLSALSLCGFTGGLFANTFTAPSSAQFNSDITRLLKTFQLQWGIAFMVASFPELLLDSMEMTGEGLIASIKKIPLLLTQTHYGMMWQLRIVSMACLCLFIAYRKTPQHTHRLLTITLFVLLTFSFSSSSHSTIDGPLSIGAIIQLIHIMSIISWAGAIMVIGKITAEALRADAISHNHPGIAMARSQSNFLMRVSLGAVVSGLLLASTMLNAFSDLWLTEYGQLVAGKFVFVMAMLSVAAMLKFFLIPSINNRQTPADTFTRIIKFDGFLVWLVLLIATQMAHTAPPSHLSF